VGIKATKMGKGYKREKAKKGQKKTQGWGVGKAAGRGREGGAEPGAAAVQARGEERER